VSPVYHGSDVCITNCFRFTSGHVLQLVQEAKVEAWRWKRKRRSRLFWSWSSNSQCCQLHHAASPVVMTRALRFGAWPNVEPLPTDVERVFSHQNCLACVLGKTNRLPHAFSAETPEYEFGEAVSLDFKVFILCPCRGIRGSICFLSGAQGYCLLS
jgi:hypothetical protein